MDHDSTGVDRWEAGDYGGSGAGPTAPQDGARCRFAAEPADGAAPRQGSRRLGGQPQRRGSASPRTQRAFPPTVQQVQQRLCPCWHRPSVHLILAAAQPPPCDARGSRHRWAATRLSAAACPAVYRELGGVPTPPNLRPSAAPGPRLARVCPPGTRAARPCRGGCGVAGSGRFGGRGDAARDGQRAVGNGGGGQVRGATRGGWAWLGQLIDEHGRSFQRRWGTADVFAAVPHLRCREARVAWLHSSHTHATLSVTVTTHAVVRLACYAVTFARSACAAEPSQTH